MYNSKSAQLLFLIIKKLNTQKYMSNDISKHFSTFPIYPYRKENEKHIGGVGFVKKCLLCLLFFAKC